MSSALAPRARFVAFLEEAGFWLICLIAAALPLAFWTLVYRSFSLPKAFVGYWLIMLLLLVGAVCIGIAKRPPPAGSTGPLLILFCLSLLPAAFFSISPTTAFLGSYRQLAGLAAWLAAAALAYSAMTITWDKSRLQDLFDLIAGLTALTALTAAAQFFWPEVNQIWHLQIDRRPVFATFGNAGYFAAWLAFALPIVLTSFLAGERRRDATVQAAIFLAGTAALAWSGSRGGWIAAWTAIALIALRYGGGPVKRKKALIAPLGLLIFLIALAAPAADHGGAPARRLTENTNTLEARAGYWRAAIAATAGKPLTGNGPDTFGLIYPQLADRSIQKLEPDTVTDDPHNYFLHLSTNFGLLPAAIFAALLINAYIICFRVAGKSNGGTLLFGLGAATAGYLVAAQTTINSWGTAFIPWLFIGIAAAGESRPKARDWPIAVGMSALALPLAFALIGLTSLWRADAYFARAQAAPAAQAIAYTKRAADLYPGNDFYWLNLARILAPVDPKGAEMAAARARRAAPRSYLPDQFLAEFYLADGRSLPDSRRLGRNAAKRGLAHFPNSPRLKRLSDLYSR